MRGAGWRPSGGGAVALAVVALALALPAWVGAAEGGALKVSCEGGKLTLEAQDVPVADVLKALEEECGLILEGAEYILDRPVTATYEKATLEEVIEAVIRLTDLPNTILASAASGALKLVVLATGETPPPKPRLARPSKERPGAAKDRESRLARPHREWPGAAQGREGRLSRWQALRSQEEGLSGESSLRDRESFRGRLRSGRLRFRGMRRGAGSAN